MILARIHDMDAWTRAGMFLIEYDDDELKRITEYIGGDWFKIE